MKLVSCFNTSFIYVAIADVANSSAMVKLITISSGKAVYAEMYPRDPSPSTNTPDIPLIFIPGFVNSTRTFTPLIPYFPNYTRIIYDMEGHGYTPAGPAPITIESLAQDLHDVLAFYGYKRSIVIGHSAGALIALQYAHQFPGAAARLVLMGPLGLPLPKEFMMANANLVREMPIEAMVAHVSSFLGAKGLNDAAISGQVRAETERHDPLREGVARHMEGVASYEFAEYGDVPTTIIRAVEDTISTAEAAESVRKLTGAEVITLDRGHYFTWENLDKAVEALRKVLQG